MTHARHTILTLLTLSLCVLMAACSDPDWERTLERSRAMPDWYEDAKLGIFIHWGPASVPAFAAGRALEPGELEEVLLGGSGRPELPYAEWYLYSMNRPDSATRVHHAETYGDAPYWNFGPEFEQRVNAGWDPHEWADLFQRMGARYVVLVTKHHDGYALWPSEVGNPHRANWFAGRDMVGELADAVRERGMRFGTYYSTGLDWTFQMEATGDLVRDVMRSAPAGEDYADYAFGQVTELIDRYRPDVLWADIGYPSMGRLGELLDYYFAEVPDGVVNDRWGAVDALGGLAAIPGAVTVLKAIARWLVENADPLADDPARIGFKTAEYASLPGIAPFKWESTRGLGASFAYNTAEDPADRLSGVELVHYVIDTVAKNGNVLINVGPDSHGSIPPEQQAPLLALGEWLAVNGEAIYGTRPWAAGAERTDVRYTRSDEYLYAMLPTAETDTLALPSPGEEWQVDAVLGAQLDGVEVSGTVLRLQLAERVYSPAMTVRFKSR